MIRVVKVLMGCVLVVTVFQLFASLFLSSVKIHKVSHAKYNVYSTSISSPYLLKEEEEIKHEEDEQRKSTLLLDLTCHYFNLKSFHQSHNFSFLNHLHEGQPLLFTRYRTFLI